MQDWTHVWRENSQALQFPCPYSFPWQISVGNSLTESGPYSLVVFARVSELVWAVWMPEVSAGSLPQSLPTLFLRQVPALKLELSDSAKARLALPSPPQLWGHRVAPSVHSELVVNLAPCSYRKHFSNWVIPQLPARLPHSQIITTLQLISELLCFYSR